MPADIETMRLLEHIDSKLDSKFSDADRKRAEGLAIVHQKIEEHATEARASLAEFSRETTSALSGIAVQLGKHDLRISSIESGKKDEATRADGWWKTGATVVLGGGGFATLLEWLRSGKPS